MFTQQVTYLYTHIMYLWWLSKLISLMVAYLQQNGAGERLLLDFQTAEQYILTGEIWICVAWEKAISDIISIPDKVFLPGTPIKHTCTHGWPHRWPQRENTAPGTSTKPHPVPFSAGSGWSAFRWKYIHMYNRVSFCSWTYTHGPILFLMCQQNI